MAKKKPAESRSSQSRLRLLKNFWVIVLSCASGIVIGCVSKDAGEGMLPFGTHYLSLLGMTVTPIVFGALTTAVGRLLRQDTKQDLLRRIIPVFAIAALIAPSVGVTGAMISRPGVSLDKESRDTLGHLLLNMDLPQLRKDMEGASGLSRLVGEVIPANIFQAFSHDKKLAVVFVSLLMGVAIGVSNTDSSARLMEVLDAVYEIFVRILNWILYLLPFGLCALAAGLAANMGAGLLSAISRILIAFYMCCGFMWLLYMVTIRLATRKSFSYIIRSLREPLTLAFFSNSLVAMPLTMKHLVEYMHQPEQIVKTVIPLGVTMNRHAYPILFAFMTVFTAQTLHMDLSYYDLAQIAVASGVVGMAAVGNTAVVAPLVAVVTDLQGLPPALAVIIMVECSGILNPMVKATNVFGCCAASTVIAAPWSKETDV